MVGYVLVPPTPAPRVAHIGNWACKSLRNNKLVNIYRQTPQKTPHEVSQIRRVLLGNAARLCRNIAEVIIIYRNFICWCLSSKLDMFSTRIEKARPTVPSFKCFVII
jgi:hypothetical protein